MSQKIFILKDQKIDNFTDKALRFLRLKGGNELLELDYENGDMFVIIPELGNIIVPYSSSSKNYDKFFENPEYFQVFLPPVFKFKIDDCISITKTSYNRYMFIEGLINVFGKPWYKLDSEDDGFYSEEELEFNFDY